MPGIPCSASVVGRALACAIAIGIVIAGAVRADFWGLMLMIVGLVPLVTELGDVSLLTEIRNAWASRECKPPDAAGPGPEPVDIPEQPGPAKAKHMKHAAVLTIACALWAWSAFVRLIYT